MKAKKSAEHFSRVVWNTTFEIASTQMCRIGEKKKKMIWYHAAAVKAGKKRQTMSTGCWRFCDVISHTMQRQEHCKNQDARKKCESMRERKREKEKKNRQKKQEWEICLVNYLNYFLIDWVGWKAHNALAKLRTVSSCKHTHVHTMESNRCADQHKAPSNKCEKSPCSWHFLYFFFSISSTIKILDAIKSRSRIKKWRRSRKKENNAEHLFPLGGIRIKNNKWHENYVKNTTSTAASAVVTILTAKTLNIDVAFFNLSTTNANAH